MDLIEEQMSPSHQVKALGQVEQGMVSKVHAIHQTVQSLSCLDAIVQLDILPHQRSLANSAGPADPDQLFLPLDGIHGLPNDICAYLGNQ